MAFGTLTQLVASKVIAPLFTKAGPPVRYTISKALNTSDALAHSAAANLVNKIPGFYAGGGAKAMGVGEAGVKTLSNMLIEQARPSVLKLRRDLGISRHTQKVAKETLSKLRTEKGLSSQAKADMKKSILSLETRKRNWVEVLDGTQRPKGQLKKRLDNVNPEDRNDLLQIQRAELLELSAQREALGDIAGITTERKGLSDLGKINMGQMVQQYLHGLMQGRPSSYLESRVGRDIFHTIGKFTNKEFAALKKYEAPHSYLEVPTSVRLKAKERIENAWGEALPRNELEGVLTNVKGEEVIMAVRKTAPSVASGNLMSEIVKRSRNDTLFKNLFKEHKRFRGTSPKKAVERMKQAMLKEWPAKDGKKSTWEYGNNFIIRVPASKKIDKSGFRTINFEVTKNGIWHGDSFKSSAHELGGVNVQSLVKPDGTVFHFVSDVQDFMGMTMPRGKPLITVSTALKKNYTKRPEQKLSKAEEKANKEWRDKPALESDRLIEQENILNVTESMRTGEAPAAFEMPKAIGGMVPRQVALTEELAAMKPDNLTMDEWIEYLTKVGIVGGTGGAIGYGLFGGE